ncbi:hypothetical protein QZJ86_17580 [Methylomonas montana]|uniref:hypothetical protein n=1 Tax=Methylomonas montana TaxID=3058963 RepID=UPI002658E9FE|nr:hypothetical protein [Methylomonas montana]WKJ89806.1 hypothetical protein QZJ86_17580 [Methylomonas montana]
MKQRKNHRSKLANAGVLAFVVFSGLLAPASASAALVSGNARISIDNSAFSAAAGWIVDRYFDASYNTTAINANTAGGSGSTSNMQFSVNSVDTTVFYGNPPNRYLEATTTDTGNTAAGQIGLSGALRLAVPGNPGAGVLMPYDFTLEKIGSIWNLVSHDLFFKGTTFLQLSNASESVNANGELTLSGDLILGGGVGPTTYPNAFGLTWSSFLGVSGAGQTAVVGSLSLTPAAVPLPSAVWLFGSSLLGLIGYKRRQLHCVSA